MRCSGLAYSGAEYGSSLESSSAQTASSILRRPKHRGRSRCAGLRGNPVSRQACRRPSTSQSLADSYLNVRRRRCCFAEAAMPSSSEALLQKLSQTLELDAEQRTAMVGKIKVTAADSY